MIAVPENTFLCWPAKVHWTKIDLIRKPQHLMAIYFWGSLLQGITNNKNAQSHCTNGKSALHSIYHLCSEQCIFSKFNITWASKKVILTFLISLSSPNSLSCIFSCSYWTVHFSPTLFMYLTFLQSLNCRSQFALLMCHWMCTHSDKY